MGLSVFIFAIFALAERHICPRYFKYWSSVFYHKIYDSYEIWIILLYICKLFGICISLSNTTFALIPALLFSLAWKILIKIIQKCGVVVVGFYFWLARTLAVLGFWISNPLEQSRNAIQWKLMFKVLRSFSFWYGIFKKKKKHQHWLIPVARHIRSILLPATYVHI